MAKVVIRRARDNRKPSSNPYRELGDERTDEHPVDRAVEAHLHDAGVRRQIGRLKQRIMKALGGDARAMLDLEVLWADTAAAREEAYFNLGYTHGFLARGMLINGDGAGSLRPAIMLRKRIGGEVANANVSAIHAALALVDSLRTMLLRLPDVPRRSPRGSYS